MSAGTDMTLIFMKVPADMQLEKFGSRCGEFPAARINFEPVSGLGTDMTFFPYSFNYSINSSKLKGKFRNFSRNTPRYIDNLCERCFETCGK